MERIDVNQSAKGIFSEEASPETKGCVWLNAWGIVHIWYMDVVIG